MCTTTFEDLECIYKVTTLDDMIRSTKHTNPCNRTINCMILFFTSFERNVHADGSFSIHSSGADSGFFFVSSTAD